VEFAVEIGCAVEFAIEVGCAVEFAVEFGCALEFAVEIGCALEFAAEISCTLGSSMTNGSASRTGLASPPACLPAHLHAIHLSKTLLHSIAQGGLCSAHSAAANAPPPEQRGALISVWQ
jgi:hypothetical protein